MGWTVLQRPPAEGWQSFLDRGFQPYKVLASAIGVDGNYYAAVERPAGNGLPRHTYAVVGLIEGAGWKLMSEDEHPFHYRAPPAVLEALSPTTSPYAIRWRAMCREALGAVVEAGELPRLADRQRAHDSPWSEEDALEQSPERGVFPHDA